MTTQQLAWSKERTLDLAGAVLEKAGHLSGALRGAIGDLRNLVRLVMAWARGEYDAVPWRSVAVALGALLYFLDPLDAVPDALPFVGYVDDASVIALVAATLKQDVQRFLRWERSRRQG